MALVLRRNCIPTTSFAGAAVCVIGVVLIMVVVDLGRTLARTHVTNIVAELTMKKRDVDRAMLGQSLPSTTMERRHAVDSTPGPSPLVSTMQNENSIDATLAGRNVSWRDVTYIESCGIGINGVHKALHGLQRHHHRVVLSHCKELCYKELQCIAFNVSGCRQDAQECGIGCELHLANDHNHGLEVSSASSVESSRVCTQDDDTRYYRLTGDVSWRQRLNSSMLEIINPDLNKVPKYEFLFRGSCCGWKKIVNAGQRSLSRCAEFCGGMIGCDAFEVRECETFEQCTGPCFLLLGARRVYDCGKGKESDHKCLRIPNATRHIWNDVRAVKEWEARTRYPFFDSVEALEKSPKWRSYLQRIYGTTIYNSSFYPLDISRFRLLYFEHLKNYNLLLPLQQGPPAHDFALHSCWAPHDPRINYIYHRTNQGVPSHSKIEVTHSKGIRVFEGHGYWMYAQPGSGIFYDVGKTRVFRTHADAVRQFLSIICIGQCVEYFEKLYKVASETLDSLQFTHHCDQCNDMLCGHEVLDLKHSGMYSCSINFTVGLGSSEPCHCQDPNLQCKNLGKV